MARRRIITASYSGFHTLCRPSMDSRMLMTLAAEPPNIALCMILMARRSGACWLACSTPNRPA